MKTTFCLITAMMLLTPPKAHAFFGHVAVERDKRIATEQKLTEQEQKLTAQQQRNIEQQRTTNRWQTTASVLGIFVVLSLVAGTAIGSKGRNDATDGK